MDALGATCRMVRRPWRGSHRRSGGGRFGLKKAAMAHRIHPSLLVLALLGLVLSSPSLARAEKPTPKDLKVGTYVEIINAWSNYVFDNQARYAGWVDMKAGPTCKETKMSPPSAVGDSAPDDYKAFKKALAKKPKLEADDAAIQMVTTLEEMMKPIKDASDYYHGREHREDGCKKGKELHSVLVGLFAKYAEADKSVRAFVEKVGSERQAAELTAAEKKHGKRLRYYHLKLPMDAKVVVRRFEEHASEQKPDLAPVREALAGFVKSLDEVKPIVDKEKQGKNADALYQGGYEMLLTKAGWFKDAVGEYMKAVDEDV
jgi:hypothetical protein